MKLLLFFFLRQDSDMHSISTNSRMLWDPKTSKISQNTKISEFSTLIEKKYDVKFGKTLEEIKFFIRFE